MKWYWSQYSSKLRLQQPVELLLSATTTRAAMTQLQDTLLCLLVASAAARLQDPQMPLEPSAGHSTIPRPCAPLGPIIERWTNSQLLLAEVPTYLYNPDLTLTLTLTLTQTLTPTLTWWRCSIRWTTPALRWCTAALTSRAKSAGATASCGCCRRHTNPDPDPDPEPNPNPKPNPNPNCGFCRRQRMRWRVTARWARCTTSR